MESKKKNFKEKEKIGSFLMNLYHGSLFGTHTNGLIDKSLLEIEFSNYCEENDFRFDKSIESLLKRYGFLIPLSEEFEEFEICLKKLFDFRTKIRDAIDRQQLCKKSQKTPIFKDKSFFLYNEVELKFHKSIEPPKKPAFRVSKELFKLNYKSCIICKPYFTLKSEFKEHIKFHTEDFELKSSDSSTKKPLFTISHHSCSNSKSLRFILKTSEKNLIIQCIVAVVPTTMIVLKENHRHHQTPLDGIDYFLIVRETLPSEIKCTIAIRFRKQGEQLSKIEQHHYLASIDNFDHVAPKVNRSLTNFINGLEEADSYANSELKDLYLKNFPDDDLIRLNSEMSSYLPNKNLNPENIVGVLKTMLQIEDIENILEVDKLNQLDADIENYEEYFIIQLKNLPSNISPEDLLSSNDQAFIVLKYEERVLTAAYNIDKVDGTKVYIKHKPTSLMCFIELQTDQKAQKNIVFEVEFKAINLNMVFQHMTLNFLEQQPNLKQLLFPECLTFENSADIKLDLNDENLSYNGEQIEAIKNIVEIDEYSKSIPFILCGPPGTGKTAVIAESILQIRKKFPSSRILVCSGSNAAIDEVVKKIVGNEFDAKVLRVYSANVAHKRYSHIDNILLVHSNLRYGDHIYPPGEIFSNFSVICCTLSVLGRYIHYENLSEQLFNYYFIDECGSITESEALIAVTGALHSQGRLILSGDIKQLGPVVQSVRAKQLGLGKSIMERLLERDCYGVDEITKDFNRRIQGRLVKNYRSHPNILNTFNDLFYESELTAHASKELTEWVLNWYNLPSLKFPIIFKAVYGDCCKLPLSTSLHNSKEIAVVMDYVKDLMYFGINGRIIKEEDIGIVSPYNDQCNFIRKEFNKRSWYRIEVGSVETFQGREKPIIIVTLVRSFCKNIKFLKCPKRLNVLLSRAQALLIIVGNPITLENIPNFQTIMTYCLENNALIGLDATSSGLQKIEITDDNSTILKSKEI